MYSTPSLRAVITLTSFFSLSVFETSKIVVFSATLIEPILDVDSLYSFVTLPVASSAASIDVSLFVDELALYSTTERAYCSGRFAAFAAASS